MPLAEESRERHPCLSRSCAQHYGTFLKPSTGESCGLRTGGSIVGNTQGGRSGARAGWRKRHVDRAACTYGQGRAAGVAGDRELARVRAGERYAVDRQRSGAGARQSERNWSTSRAPGNVSEVVGGWC